MMMIHDTNRAVTGDPVRALTHNMLITSFAPDAFEYARVLNETLVVLGQATDAEIAAAVREMVRVQTIAGPGYTLEDVLEAEVGGIDPDVVIDPDVNLDDALDSARWIRHLVQRMEDAVLTCEDADNYIFWVQAAGVRIAVTYWCGDDGLDAGIEWTAHALGEAGNHQVADGHWLYGDRTAAGREIEKILGVYRDQYTD